MPVVRYGSMSIVPRHLWMLWFQGEKNAPEIVRRCINSWRRLNPGWTVHVLDRQSIRDVVTIDLSEATLQKLALPMQADLFRLALLRQHGGVWADATTLCVRPLDDYIDATVAASGFFAFRNRNRERMISNWFLSATPDHPIVVSVLSALVHYFLVHPPGRASSSLQVLGHKLVRELLRQHRALTPFWLHPWIIRISGRHPYFLFHFTFYALTRSDPEVGDLWAKTTAVSNRSAKVLSRFADRSGEDREAIEAVQQAGAWLFKLTWKNARVAAIPAGTVIARYLEPYSAS
jgi:hypothetical protein